MNPVIGIGSVLAQLVLREPLAKILTYEYQIGGSWAEPTITNLKKPNDAREKSQPSSKTDQKKGA